MHTGLIPLFMLLVLKQYFVKCFLPTSLVIHRNTRFTNSDNPVRAVLRTVVDISVRECVRECGARPACIAAEYNDLSNYCTLLSEISAATTASGFVTVTGFDDTVLCGEAACGKKETCETTSETCIVKECGYPDFGGSVIGNRFEVRSRIRRDCLGVRELICTEQGEWSPPGILQFTGLTCRDVKESSPGARSSVYKNGLGMLIFCDFDTDGGNWLVFQRRLDGTVDFYRNWTSYRNGFGEMCGNFWLGLENLQTILESSPSQFELRIDLEDWEGNTKYAVYSTFDISDESDAYRLTCDGYSGTAANSLSLHNGHPFSTSDVDNDSLNGNCAEMFHGAWWYKDCHHSNLNGFYYQTGPITDYARGLIWVHWKGNFYSLKTASMKIREK